MMEKHYNTIVYTCLAIVSIMLLSLFANFVYVDDFKDYDEVRNLYRRATNDSPENQTVHEIVNHTYYIATYLSDEDYWVNELDHPLVISETLSTSSRHAQKVNLNFSFPFYGYNTSQLYVSSGGFLYVGPLLHRYMAETQYVAPLMADFDPSLHEGSTISYSGNEKIFVAEWRNVHLAHGDTTNNFTFQTIIHCNGTLVFSYKDIPVNIESISDETHPVKVGVADAFYYDTVLLAIFTKRTIYEYHAVDLEFDRVDQSKAVVLTPLESCNSRTSCASCQMNPPSGFECKWCNKINRCSDGFDRHRQAWRNAKCNQTTEAVCPTSSSSPYPTNPVDECSTMNCNKGNCIDNVCHCPKFYAGKECQVYTGDTPGVTEKATAPHSHAAGWVITILVLIIIFCCIIGWISHAYRYPNTKSGLLLIDITRCRYFHRSSSNSNSYRYQKTSANV